MGGILEMGGGGGDTFLRTMNQFSGFFTFDLFDLLNLTPWVHCYILLIKILLTSIILHSKDNEIGWKHSWK